MPVGRLGRSGAVVPIAVVLAVAGLGACAGGPGGIDVRWQQVADGPLSDRQGAVVVWLDDTFVVTGGYDAPPCPPNADCAWGPDSYLSDGATYDPVTDRWDRIADAPSVMPFPSAASVDGRLYMLSGSTGGATQTPAFVSYDPALDRWTSLPLPPAGGGTLVAAGHVLLDVGGSDELEDAVDSWFDPVTARWQRLPDDPLGPSFDRAAVVVGGQVILTAKDLTPSPGSARPAVVRMATLDLAALGTGASEAAPPTWTVLPDSEVIGSGPVVAGDHVVFPELGGGDGGDVGNWGRDYPSGGVYDPTTNTWQRLDGAWRPDPRPWPHLAVGGFAVVGRTLLDPVSGLSGTLPPDPWSDKDAPSFGTSPTAVFVWGGASDRHARGFLLDVTDATLAPPR